jgi:hypothetical protein
MPCKPISLFATCNHKLIRSVSLGQFGYLDIRLFNNINLLDQSLDDFIFTTGHVFHSPGASIISNMYVCICTCMYECMYVCFKPLMRH